MTKDIILITGGTNGLGKLTAKKLYNLGHTVIITGRSEANLTETKEYITSSGAADKGKVHGIILDLKDLKSVQDAVKSIEALHLPSLDVIIHNAGGTTTELKLVNNEVEETLFINAVSPLYLNRLLMPMIEKSTSPNRRIIFVTSMMYDPSYKDGSSSPDDLMPISVEKEDLKCEGRKWTWLAYYKISKLGSIWNMYTLAERYPTIKIIAFCPGFVPTTELNRNSGFFRRMMLKYFVSRLSITTTIEDSTDDYVYYATSDTITSKTIYAKREAVTPSADAGDRKKQENYWEYANKNINEIINA